MTKKNVTLVLLAPFAAVLLVSYLVVGERSPDAADSAAYDAGASSGSHVAEPGSPVDTRAEKSRSEEGPWGVQLADASAEADEGDSLEDRVDHLRQMFREEDFSGVEAAVASLSAILDKPGAFGDLMAHFLEEADSEMSLQLAQILARRFHLHGAEFETEVLEMAGEDPLPSKRTAALSLLSSVRDPSPDMVAAVAGVSRGDGSLQVRLNAIYTLSHWADNPARWEEVSHELVYTIDASEIPEVRGSAIQVLALRGGSATDTILAAMVDYLENDPTPKNRAIAALALGDVPAELRPAALGHLKTAFAEESDLDIRRNIMTQIARAGEEDALPILLQLETDHPLLEQDVIDYIELLESGNVDPSGIYQHKFALDAERDTVVGSPDHED